MGMAEKCFEYYYAFNSTQKFTVELKEETGLWIFKKKKKKKTGKNRRLLAKLPLELSTSAQGYTWQVHYT